MAASPVKIGAISGCCNDDHCACCSDVPLKSKVVLFAMFFYAVGITAYLIFRATA
jgi:hypothetical protein